MSDAARPLDPNLSLDVRVLSRPLVIQASRLAGFRHHQAPALLSALRPGCTLALTAEADNPHDPDAVAVYWNGFKLGYIPSGENLVAARLLARRRNLSARIRRLRPRAEHNRRIELEVLMQ
jgi:hypothetical protein